VAVTRDGKRIVTGSSDGTVRVWDAKTGQSLADLKGHTGGVLCLAVSGDGAFVVTGAGDGTARVWHTRAELSILEFQGHTQPVTCLMVSADGSRVVSGSNDKTARVWDARTGRAVLRLEGHTDWVSSLAMSADGTRIVTGSGDGTARVWDAKTGRSVLEIKGPPGGVTHAAVSPDGSRIATWVGGRSFVWDAAGGRRMTGPPVPLSTTRYRTPDGGHAFVSDGNDVLRIPIRIDEGERLRRLWLTRPDPDWHIQRQKELTAEGNTYGAALHRALEQHARGVLAVEAGDLDRAWGYFIAAAALKPAPPEIVTTIPLAR
jgi:WD40 repeat protein